MSLPTLVLFVIFALILIGGYIGIRRGWASPFLLGTIMIFSGFIVMFMAGLAQGNEPPQALFNGILVGVLFSVGTVAMAWYFQSAENRSRTEQAPQESTDVADATPDETTE